MSILLPRKPRIVLPIILATLFTVSASGQHAASPAPSAAPPQISPRAAYDDAMHPLELTRQSFSNWSGTEIEAFQVTMAKATAACAVRDPQSLPITDLVDMERLCALGQVWPRVIDAATRYIAADTPNPKPRLTEAYSMLVDAQLRIHNEPAALAATQAMLARLPYDALAAGAANEAINYMQFRYTADALAVATARQPLLLERIHALTLPPTAASPTPISQEAQSLHELYADGIVLPILQGYAKQDTSASSLAKLDAALPSTLLPDDAVPIATTRRRYALLSKPLPAIPAIAFLSLPGKVPELPAAHAITALLLFPDWCAQCVRMGHKFPETVFTVSGHEAYLYGLLAQTVKQNLPQRKQPGKPALDPVANSVFTPADASSLLQETPTLVVKPETLDSFAATDVPFLVVADSHGIVRVAQPVGEDAIDPGNSIDSAIAMVGSRWPLRVPPTAPAASASPIAITSSQNP